jgi:maltose O-acetyltransferase
LVEAVVGAGAVVSKGNVADYSIVIGNLAKAIHKRTNLEYNPCEFLAANNAWIK